MEAYKQLEEDYAKFVSARHAVSVSSGTAALHLALLALGVGEGDYVLVPDFTMAACAFAVSYTRAKPVFIDVDPDTYSISIDSLKSYLTTARVKPKAMIVVHLYGRLADMKELYELSNKYEIPIIEDACEAQGAVYESKAAITVYSFYKNKIIAGEEGGMVTTDSVKLAARVEYLKNMAFGEKHDYYHKVIGYNYRMPNAQAMLVLRSLYRYKENAIKRRQVEIWYDKYLPFLIKNLKIRRAVWFYDIRVPASQQEVAVNRIEGARYGFKRLSSMPMYKFQGDYQEHKVSQQLSQEVVLLPVRPDMTEEDVLNICNLL